ncbi:GntR family transcriptional regulator [Latilactobacillus fuchuensis]|uniref:GntR family transcriptional regulator n=1 Tax=Latilactobacillus fuchuensis TaxID=164393 RepID=UPI000AEA0B42|nr:GntR family transcriptional regulator [Latilactobacillus fuchuensis]
MIDWTRYPLNEKPKYRALQRLIEALIQQGLLLAGEQLPAERQLAIQLGLNRSTVARAFDELASAGFLERQVGRGTYISQAALTQMTHKRVNWHTYLTTQRRPKGQRIRQQYQALIQQAPAGLIDGFSSDLPTELVPAFQLPALRWTDFVKAQELERPNGYQPLLAAVQQHYSSTLTVSQLLITAGAQQSLLLVLQGLLIPGEAVAIEQLHSSMTRRFLKLRVFEPIQPRVTLRGCYRPN